MNVPLKSKTKMNIPIVLQVETSAKQMEGKKKGRFIKDRKEKATLFADDIILHTQKYSQRI